MHFVMRTNLDEPAFSVRATIVNMEALRGVKRTAGASFGGSFPRLKLRLDDEGEAADFFESGPFIVISKRMRAILSELGCVVEYHGIDLVRIDGAPHKDGYCIANIVAAIDCFDYRRAIYEMDGDYIDRIDVLAIKEELAGDAPIFRLKNSYDNIVFAGESLVARCRDGSISGVEFVSPQQWP